MSFAMFAPQQKAGDRPGQTPSANFLKRLQDEVYAARGTGVDTPLISESGPSGTTIGLERITLDLRRFVLTENLLAGSYAAANTVVYDNDKAQWTIVGESFTVWDSLTRHADGTILLRTGQYGFAKWFSDNGLWELVSIGDLISDDFFPAKVTSHTGSPPKYSWTEQEWTSSTAAASTKSGGRTGSKSAPVSWPAMEINGATVTDNTIVWMKRGFKPTSPAVAVITKTLAGNGAGTHAALSLYLDQYTSGTYTITWDGHTTAAISYAASAATTQAAIEAAVTGLTLAVFGGSGTIGAPWTFTCTSDANDHTASTNAAALKGNDGFRFDMSSSGGGVTACGWDAVVSGYDAGLVNILTVDASGCLVAVHPATCTTPYTIDGGSA